MLMKTEEKNRERLESAICYFFSKKQNKTKQNKTKQKQNKKKNNNNRRKTKTKSRRTAQVKQQLKFEWNPPCTCCRFLDNCYTEDERTSGDRRRTNPHTMTSSGNRANGLLVFNTRC